MVQNPRVGANLKLLYATWFTAWNRKQNWRSCTLVLMGGWQGGNLLLYGLPMQ